MKIFDITDSNHCPTTATIGFFDGVHNGHRFLIDTVKQESICRNQKSMIVTFDNHPKLLFEPLCKLKQLTLTNERIPLLEKTGIDYTLVLDFNQKLASYTSSEFMDMMKERFCVNTLVIGYDHHFGSDIRSSFTDYRQYGKTIGMEVIDAKEFTEKNIAVSSSKIRKALENRDIITANEYLGYNYTINGTVVDGNKIGRTIDFPTANISVDKMKLIPSDGVYAAKAIIDSHIYKAMVNIGNRPTISNENITTIEAHIIDFDENIYNKNITIEFVDFIRGEKKFNNIQLLKQQLITDKNNIIDIVKI
ncbi:MAG: bifunctional riboflavin kinase/FAD synthetase [Candidatus Aphodosoma sp.]